MMITAYTIDEKMIDMRGKQTAKLHKEGKYARKSTRNYGDCVKCIIIRFSFLSSTTPFLKNPLSLAESNNRCTL